MNSLRCFILRTMPGHFSFFTQEIHNQQAVFDENETRHAIHTLRYKEGDTIHFTDGLGQRYLGRIDGIKKNSFTASIFQQETEKNPGELSLGVGLIKNTDRLEWLVEKCTELGVKQLWLLNTGNAEKRRVNLDRLQKIAIAALKQSHGYRLPMIGMATFADMMSVKSAHRFICYCSETAGSGMAGAECLKNDCLVLIGPEGDFTRKEAEQAVAEGFTFLSLGPAVLRTETACMAVSAIYAVQHGR
jgi:16S rRNA (uracil1498-N3)-methyltransferase